MRATEILGGAKLRKLYFNIIQGKNYFTLELLLYWKVKRCLYHLRHKVLFNFRCNESIKTVF